MQFLKVARKDGNKFTDEEFDGIDEMLYWDGFTDSGLVTSYTNAASLSATVGKIELQRLTDLHSGYVLDISDISFRDVRQNP